MDGDRDVERRRKLAAEHVARAQALLQSGAEVEQRVDALRALNAALALDPTHAGALAMLARIVTETPERLPPDAEEELSAERAKLRSRAARTAGTAVGLAWLLVPFAIWLGPKSYRLGVPFVVFALATSLAVWRTARTGRVTRAHTLLTALVALGGAASTSVIFGSLVATPTLTLAVAVVLIVNSRADRTLRMGISALALLGLVLPLGLQLAGVLPRSYAFEAGRFVVEPWATAFNPLPTLTFLVFFSGGILLLAAGVLGRTVDALALAERRQFSQGWQLRQLFPEKARVTERPPAP